MAFEETMGRVMQWATATEALAAVGAELALLQPGVEATPEVAAAVRAVSTAAGIDLSEAAPPQRAMLAAFIRMYLHQALELLENPDRAPGWTYTDPDILDGWGRGSALVPAMMANAHPDLAGVQSFLDVGTGVGLLAIAAANVWPGATVVGIDPWETSLKRARANVSGAGLDDRITLRQQTLADLDDEAAYDCIWIPTFFLTEEGIVEGLTAAVRALRPGGWIALGRMRPAPDPVADAVATLRWIRGGGCSLDAKRAVELLEAAGLEDAHNAPLPGPAPLELALGRRPAV